MTTVFMSPHACAVVVERCSHTPHVGAGWVAGDQPLDELLADEGPTLGWLNRVSSAVFRAAAPACWPRWSCPGRWRAGWSAVTP